MGVTSVRLQPDVESDLEAMAGKLHRSKNWLINQAIREFVEREQREQVRWQETLAAMESVAQGKVVEADAVNAWLDSWGDADERPPPRSSP